MAKKIEPTIGRVVWFWPHPLHLAAHVESGSPCRADVCFVTKLGDDYLLNLAWNDHLGNPFRTEQVPLIQDGDPVPQHSYATWMPFQIGQAAKTEEIARSVREGFTKP